MTPAPVGPLETSRWNTLQILKGMRVILPVLTGLLLILILEATGVHRTAMRTVGVDAAPSIVYAQKIRAALAGMDANAANELLGDVNTATPAAAGFEQRRVDASRALVEAAKDITHDAEREPIDTLAVSMGTYARLIEDAIDLREDGAGLADDARAAAFDMSRRFYRASAIIMDGTLLPAADDLDKASDVVLESKYKSESQRSMWMLVLVLLAGMVLLAGLLAAQVFLLRRTRRLTNPLLLAATAATLGLTIYAMSCLGSEEHHLKRAKEDAFTSVHALWRARSVAYAANAEESRFLLDRAEAGEYQAGFFAKANALAHIPASTPLASLLDVNGRGDGTPGFTGYLADELGNITFHGEREAAVKTLAAWEAYVGKDAEFRQADAEDQKALAAGDKEAAASYRQKAIHLCTGTSEGDLAWAFHQFDAALGETLAINQREFEDAVAQGFGALKNLEWIAAVAAVLIAVLTFVGLAPRIREYQEGGLL